MTLVIFGIICTLAAIAHMILFFQPGIFPYQPYHLTPALVAALGAVSCFLAAWLCRSNNTKTKG